MTTVTNKHISYELVGERLELLPEKAIYWEAERMLIVADLHFGKVTHFRKSGIAIPMEAAEDGIIRLETLINEYQADRLMILGDLFHSELNHEWDDFLELCFRNQQTQFELVIGNHDILKPELYERSPMVIHHESYSIGPFLFSHDEMDGQGQYNMHGHIHPGVKLYGRAKQSLRMPCYLFGPQRGVLPAFGTFTGLHILKRSISDDVFIIAADVVMKLE